jgi:hypothetical protein
MSDTFAASNFSIVVQGGLGPQNIAAVATNCVHWRTIFPEAEIILSISSVEGLRLELSGDRVVAMTPDPLLAVGSMVLAAARTLMAACDAVVLAGDALPLPPIKSDSSAPNHANLQIAAARRGLEAVTRSHLLRVRCDLIFLDGDFIDQWRRLKSLHRGNAAILGDRVLVSNLYTLNPYTFERLPFHISDWFHFGRTDDVRQIWDVPPVPLADAVHYTTVAHDPTSNLDERKMLCRVAVEQHIIFEGIGRRLPDIRLDRHNDWSSRERFLDLLCDNFVIADLVAARCVFPKYAQDIGNPRKDVHCIGQADWKALVVAADRRAVLRRRADQIDHPERLPFPRRYEARVLTTKSGQRTLRDIVSSYHAGVLLHGPYAARAGAARAGKHQSAGDGGGGAPPAWRAHARTRAGRKARSLGALRDRGSRRT